MDNLKSKTFSGFIWKFVERFFVQGVAFIVSLVLARILTPEDYGLVAMVTVFINIASVIVANGFNAALIQSKTVDEKDFSTLFFISLFFSFILYWILYFIAPFIAKFYGYSELVSIIRVLGFSLPIASVSSIQNAYIGRMLDFRKNFIASLISSILSGFIGVYFALKGRGVWALVIQNLFNSFVICVVQFFIVPWRPKLCFSLKQSTPLLKFGASSLGSDLLNTIFNQINAFVIGKWYTPEQLAYYNKGGSFPGLIHNNVSVIAASVMFPVFSKRADDIQNLKMMLKKAIALFTYVLTPLYMGIIAVSKNLVVVLLTEKWLPAVPYVCIIGFVSVLGTISPLDVIVLKSIGRSDIVLRLELIKKPIWLLLLIFALFVNTYAIACVLVVTTIIETFINGIVINKYLGYSLGEKLFDWGKAMLPSIIMFLIVYLMNFIPINTTILLLMQIFVGVAFYILYSVITKNEYFYYLFNILKSKINGEKND